ncbi:hypothetical protein [Hyphomonas sp. UBA4494]|uniref:hypothetical protein n=1 Tax=Hyphomonas sp. UBA4494 TaxID=1946631 RepID=UPI0025B7C0B9|nr:hypothetical protein [Hyphomonas sp. UBA4494]
MKHHIMLALGILLGLVFAVRLAVAILQPGLGFREVYLAGGLVLSAWLMLGGVAEWCHTRATGKVRQPSSED